MEGFHPKAVEMKDFNRDISRLHPFEERIYGLFIVICGEAGAEPEAKTPARNFSWLASQDGVFLENLFRRWAMYDVPSTKSEVIQNSGKGLLPFQSLTFNACLNSTASRTPNFEVNFVRGVYEDTISTGTDPERNILICLIT